MRHLDTSFLAPLILPEATSARIAGFFDDLPMDDLAVSHWTRVEFASLPGLKARMGSLNASAARQAGLRFESMIAESFVVFLPNRDDFDLARDWPGRFETGLRSGDALHLAMAGNRETDRTYSLDRLMINAGQKPGLPTSTGIPLPDH